MNKKQSRDILQSCENYVKTLCVNVAPDHGYEHAIFVANVARLGLADFAELSDLNQLLVMLAALMHDIDDPKIFSTSNYSNATAFLDAQPMLTATDKQFVIRMISLVSYSQNKNTTPAEYPKWAFIPRDADRIAGGGQEGIDRTLAFNKVLERPRPVVLPEDIQLFSNFPVDRKDVQSKYTTTITKQRSLFEFYITNWHDRGICASGSPALQKIFDVEYGVLLDFWVAQINAFPR
jgi:HD superfamily phosphodiesterase